MFNTLRRAQQTRPDSPPSDEGTSNHQFAVIAAFKPYLGLAPNRHNLPEKRTKWQDRLSGGEEKQQEMPPSRRFGRKVVSTHFSRSSNQEFSFLILTLNSLSLLLSPRFDVCVLFSVPLLRCDRPQSLSGIADSPLRSALEFSLRRVCDWRLKGLPDSMKSASIDPPFSAKRRQSIRDSIHRGPACADSL